MNSSMQTNAFDESCITCSIYAIGDPNAERLITIASPHRSTISTTPARKRRLMVAGVGAVEL